MYINGFLIRLGILWRRLIGICDFQRSGVVTLNKKRILYVANAFIPTLQLSFVKPLQKLVDENKVATELLSEQQMKELFGRKLNGDAAIKWTLERLNTFNPTHIVFCRYSGPHSPIIIEFAKRKNIKTIFHIDDDLINVPIEIGEKKFKYHNQPSRISSVRYLMSNVDVVYCSTKPLQAKLLTYGLDSDHVTYGPIYCSGEILVKPKIWPVIKIGYMGFDHAFDFEIALPAIVEILNENSTIVFELFGSIPKPAILEQFGSRVVVIPPISDYQLFLAKFSQLNWSIAICPLASTEFNAVKANTKWVEYTSVGAAVIATKGTIYDDCCAGECGMLVESHSDWKSALEVLINDTSLRLRIIENAQEKVLRYYSLDALRKQVVDIIELEVNNIS